MKKIIHWMEFTIENWIISIQEKKLYEIFENYFKKTPLSIIRKELKKVNIIIDDKDCEYSYFWEDSFIGITFSIDKEFRLNFFGAKEERIIPSDKNTNVYNYYM